MLLRKPSNNLTLESEVLIGRIDGSVQMASLDYQSQEIEYIPVVQLVGKIVGIWILKQNQPISEQMVLVVSSVGEVVIFKKPTIKDLGSEADKETRRVPLHKDIYKKIDVRKNFAVTVTGRLKPNDGLEGVKKFFTEEEEQIIYNEEIQLESNKKKPNWLIKAWQINRDGGSPSLPLINIRCADVDHWTGKNRLMVGGDGFGIYIIDYIEGKAIFASRSHPPNMLAISRSANVRVCAFVSQVGDGNLFLSGNDENEVMLYNPKKDKDEFTVLKYGSSSRFDGSIDTEAEISTKMGDLDCKDILRYDREPKVVACASDGFSVLSAIAYRPALVYEDEKPHFRNCEGEKSETAFISTFDSLGSGQLWKIEKRENHEEQYVPRPTKRKKIEDTIYKEISGAGDIRTIEKGMKYTLKMIRGFHAHTGSPTDAQIHQTGTHLIVSSFGNSVWAYPTEKGRMSHLVYTTAPLTCTLLSNLEVEDATSELPQEVWNKR